MSSKFYFLISAVIFLIVTTLHILRLVYGWEANIGGYQVPELLSYFAIVLFGLLAFSGFRLATKSAST